jgi:hypothetical protein
MIGTNVSLLINDWKNKFIKLILGYLDCKSSCDTKFDFANVIMG